MKRFFLLFVGFLLVNSFLSAAGPVDYKAGAGDWKLSGARLYQNDSSNGALMAHLSVPQNGLMAYNFNVRYEGGAAADRQGGFGIHLFVDKPSSIKNSWGDGDSVLVWLNYDADPVLDDIPAGLSAAVYHSSNNSVMELAGAYDLNSWSSLLTPNAGKITIPVELTVNGRTGDAWIRSPLDSSVVYRFNLGKKNLQGDYVSLRTNGMAVSFGM